METLLERVAELRRDGHRLCIIDAVAVPAEGAVDITWTFEKGGKLAHLRERVAAGAEVPSVSGLYPFAYLYENELRELFGVVVTGLNVDLKGQLYQTSTKIPMSPRAIRERLEAAKVKRT